MASCARQPAASKVDRIAVLRFENLSSDNSLSWVGRALSEVVTAQLASVPGTQVLSSQRLHSYDRLLGPRPVAAPGISAESTQALLAGATRVVYGEYTVRNGKLEADVTIEDLKTRRMLGTFFVAAPAGNVLGVANEIARQIQPKAAAYATRSGDALAAYIRALESGDAGQMEQGLTAAIQADPDFAQPYRLLAQERVQRGDQVGAAAALEQALVRGDRFSPLERTRIEVQAAEISVDAAARKAALIRLVKLDPADPVAWRALADSSMNDHDYRRAMESYQKSVEIEPGDANTWNSLGLCGDSGRRSGRRYCCPAPLPGACAGSQSARFVG